MSIDVEEYKRLKAKADALKADADKAEGALENQLKQLRDEFDCDDLDEAKELLASLKKRERIAETKYDKALAKFRGKWDELDGDL